MKFTYNDIKTYCKGKDPDTIRKTSLAIMSQINNGEYREEDSPLFQFQNAVFWHSTVKQALIQGDLPRAWNGAKARSRAIREANKALASLGLKWRNM